MRRIVAVIVTYFPDYTALSNIRSLVDKVWRVVVVDNTPNGKSKSLFNDLSKFDNVDIVYNGRNYGIGYALNTGVRIAIKHKSEWILTLDQDSCVSCGMLEAMLNCYDQDSEKELIASFAPRYHDRRSGTIWGNILNCHGYKNEFCADVLYALTSGNLVKIDVFNSVGFYNESYFVDYIDVEFGLRCGMSGFRTVEVKDALLFHSIGSFVEKKIINSSVFVTFHSPLRRYYMYRNAIVTYKSFFQIYPRWVIHNAYVLFKTFIIILIFEPSKYENFKHIFHGIVDGIFNVSGECKKVFKLI